ncbi:MAG TPA: response regulator, partial [Thioploca sp.]|nr:response regulator [Thioploca sp.]
HDDEVILKYKTALIVDDDMRNIFSLVAMLEDKDMEAIIAKNGQEALVALEKHPEVSIVIMDVMMPGMDGYETMRQIRKQPNHRKLPIIALTAKAMKDDRAKCIEAGANDYISKPVDNDKLISLLRVWLYR